MAQRKYIPDINYISNGAPPRGPQMSRKPPKNESLIEAISEPRWKPHEPSLEMKAAPHQKMPISKMCDNINDEYRFHEQLPTATMSDEIAR